MRRGGGVRAWVVSFVVELAGFSRKRKIGVPGVTAVGRVAVAGFAHGGFFLVDTERL